MRGLDVSELNGDIDWKSVVDAGYEFVIVRCTYGLHERDSKFIENVNGAHDAGLQVGAYHFSYGYCVDDAVAEAQNCKSFIEESGLALELPVFYDMEPDPSKVNHGFVDENGAPTQDVTAMCKAFIDNLGLNCGVYSCESWFNNYIDWSSLECPVWNAAYMFNHDYNPDDYPSGDGIKGYMWQYTSSAMIDGKAFDADVLY